MLEEEKKKNSKLFYKEKKQRRNNENGTSTKTGISMVLVLFLFNYCIVRDIQSLKCLK